MNRRNLFKLAAGAASALILPPTLAENAEAGKRYWALGAMPQSDLISWQSDTVPNAVAQLGKFADLNFSYMDQHEAPWNDDGLPIGRGLYKSSLDTNEIPLGRRIVHDFDGMRDPQWRTSERVYYEVEGRLLYSVSWTQSGWIRE